jgi:biotin carboxylase
MRSALGSFVVKGVPTVIPFLLFLLDREEYRTGDVNTKWLESMLNEAHPA